MTTDKIKEAVDKVKFYLSNGQAALSDNVLKTLITAAEKSCTYSCDKDEGEYEKKCVELRARIAELEKDRPEVTTKQMMQKIRDISEEDLYSDVNVYEIIARLYPNGLRIVQDKEGG